MINTREANYLGFLEVNVEDYISACERKIKDIDNSNEVLARDLTPKITLFDIFYPFSENRKKIKVIKEDFHKNNNMIDDLANTIYMLKTYTKETMLVNLDLYGFIRLYKEK